MKTLCRSQAGKRMPFLMTMALLCTMFFNTSLVRATTNTPGVWLEYSDEEPEPGDTVRVMVHFGTESEPLPPIGQLKVAIGYDELKIEEGTEAVILDGSWLFDESDDVNAYFENDSLKLLINCITDCPTGREPDGYGLAAILQFNIIMIENVNGKTQANPTEPFKEKINSYLYPNPASDYVTIHLSEAQPSRIEVLRPNGQLAGSVAIKNGRTCMLPVDQYPPGLYFIRVYTASSSHVQRLMIARQ